MNTIQMNTRMDVTLKSEGDSILAGMGYSPSQAVRAFWRYVVQQRNHPQQIEKVLSAGKDGIDSDGMRKRMEAVAAGRKLCDGLRPAFPELASAPYKELRDAVFATSLEDADTLERT